MADPTCAELRSAYLTLLLGGGEVLVKAGDMLVKYTDASKLKAIIEEMCGPIKPEGSTANRGLKLHQARVNGRGGCGCSGDDNE